MPRYRERYGKWNFLYLPGEKISSGFRTRNVMELNSNRKACDMTEKDQIVREFQTSPVNQKLAVVELESVEYCISKLCSVRSSLSQPQFKLHPTHITKLRCKLALHIMHTVTE